MVLVRWIRQIRIYLSGDEKPRIASGRVFLTRRKTRRILELGASVSLQGNKLTI